MKEFKWKLIIALSISLILLIVIFFFIDVDNNTTVNIVKNGDNYLVVSSEKIYNGNLEYCFDNFSSKTFFNYLYTENGINYYYAKLDRIPNNNLMIIKNGKIKIYELFINYF